MLALLSELPVADVSFQPPSLLFASQLSKYQFANDFESKTKLPKAVSFLGLAAFVSIALFLNVLGLAGPLSFLIGSVLPTYTSIQALESAGHEDDTQSLFYWVVFTALTAVEYIAIRPILCMSDVLTLGGVSPSRPLTNIFVHPIRLGPLLLRLQVGLPPLAPASRHSRCRGPLPPVCQPHAPEAGCPQAVLGPDHRQARLSAPACRAT